MAYRRSVLFGTASMLAVAAVSAPALAQQAAPSQPNEVKEVVVTGIRASLQKAIQMKRRSDDVVDVISSEDIGKLPDRNVADAIQRLPGVNTQSAASGEGGFDERDRVTVRGTPSSLTQVTIDGHAVATGDWFVLDQTTAVGRSVSMALLPSQIVDNLIVDKSQNASLTEGGTAASVDIQTRKPLDFTKPITVEASFEGAYNSLTGTTKPQINALLGWKSSDGTFGVLLQGFYEERDVRRYGQETLGWSKLVAPNCGTTPMLGADGKTYQLNNPAPTIANNAYSCAVGSLTGGNQITYKNANTTGAAYPTLIGSTLFEQQRKREGGDFTAQWRPNDQFEVKLDAFYSDLNATNFNDNYMFDGSREFTNGAPTSFTMANNTITSAVFPSNPTGNNIAAVVDNIIRPDAEARTEYVNLDAKLKVSDKLTFKGQIGYTEGLGNTPQQPLFEVDNVSSPASYGLSGNGMAVNFPGQPSQSATGLNVDWAQNFRDKSVDSEFYAKVDGDWVIDDGLWKDVSFGVRYGDHKRQVDAWDRGCTLATPLSGNGPINCIGDYGWSGNPVPFSTVSPTSYPGGFSAGALGVPGLLIPLAGNPGQIVSLINGLGDPNRGSIAHTVQPINYYYPWSFKVEEQDAAGYVMARVGGERWRANFGVRLVDTKENAYVNTPDPQGTNPADITTSAFGAYFINHVQHDYFDILPSLNVTFDVKPDLLLRFSAAEAMSRPDYSALGGAVNLTDTNLTGNAGNPNLKPVKSANFNTSLEWYYGKQSALTFDLFYMDLQSYVAYGTSTQTYFCPSCGPLPPKGQPLQGAFEPFVISAPYNITGAIRGFELAWQQPIAYGFGIIANYTYADGEDANGNALVGDSKDTFNVTGYYEKGRVSARLAYTYRTHYFVGLDRSSAENMDDSDVLDASINIKVTDNIGLSFQGLNLTNSLEKYYADNRSQPRAVYENGTQAYFGIHVKY